ncbi:hypothetical protein HPB50_008957 [Hyalomma asiaticum]|uniref:Uncharacterized protein n=1 Tax=Hyalomma asiaticum TaxID=266040 RepID=A0ACB7T6T1_HYAAI|nr:hypothetical protein HPB50_008957 [Hyalomma asiaticum]
MAENSKGAPQQTPEPKSGPGTVPVTSSSSDPQGQRAPVREGDSKNPTGSGQAEVKQPGSSDAAPATSQSDPKETVSGSSTGITSPLSSAQARTVSSPYSVVGSGTTSLLSPGTPSCISEAERRLAELTVLRGRKLPLSESELPLSPMLERDRSASKGRRVSIDMMPTIDLISPRSALASPLSGPKSPDEEMPATVPPAAPAAPPNPPPMSAVKEGDRKPSVSGIRSSLLTRRKASTDSEKRAVVCPPALKVRSSASTEPRRPPEAGTGLPPEEKQPETCIPGEQHGSNVGVPDIFVGPRTTDPASFYNNQGMRGRRCSYDPRSSRRSSLQRFRRGSSSMTGGRGSRDIFLQGPSGPVEPLSFSVGQRSVSKGTLMCVVFIFVMVLAALTMFIANHFMKPPFVADQGVCASDDCVRHAVQILRTLNTSADPCLDFHAYVCGSGDVNVGEAQSNGTRKDPDGSIGSIDEINPSWRLARLYAYQVNNILGNLHQLVAVKRTSETTLKAFAALSLCLQRKPKQRSKSFAAFMKARKLPWPLNPPQPVGLVDVLDILMDLSINWRASIWVDVRVLHLDARSVTGPLVVLDEPGHVPLIRMEQMSTLNDTEYASAVERTVHFLGSRKTSSDTSTRGFEDVDAMDQLKRDETDIRGSLVSTLRGGGSYDTLVPLHMLRLTLNITLEEWVSLLRKYLAPAGLNVTIDTAVLILNNPQFKVLSALLSNTPAPRLLNVLGWMFAYSYSWTDNADFDVLSNEAVAGSGGPSRNSLFAHVLCFVAVHESVGTALEAALFFHYFPSEERLKVTKIINATARGLVEAVRGSPSVSSTTKDDAEAKISLAVSRHFWAPKPLLDLDYLDSLYNGFPSMPARTFYASWMEFRKALRDSLPNTYYGTVMTAKLMRYASDIIYMYSLNMVLLDIAAVFPPKYLKGGNSIMAYAGLGFQLLRQLVKSVDERGRQLDYATGKKIGWWEENRVCEIHRPKSTKEKREIKDLFALELALAVSQNAAAADVTAPRLKHLEKLTAVQTFYVSYCSHFCGEFEEQEMCNLATKSSRFAEAFACCTQRLEIFKRCASSTCGEYRCQDLYRFRERVCTADCQSRCFCVWPFFRNNDGRCVPFWKCYTYRRSAWLAQRPSGGFDQGIGQDVGTWGAASVPGIGGGSGPQSGGAISVGGQWPSGSGSGQLPGGWSSGSVSSPYGSWGGMSSVPSGSWSFVAAQYPGASGTSVSPQYGSGWSSANVNGGFGNGNVGLGGASGGLGFGSGVSGSSNAAFGTSGGAVPTGSGAFGSGTLGQGMNNGVFGVGTGGLGAGTATFGIGSGSSGISSGGIGGGSGGLGVAAGNFGGSTLNVGTSKAQ